MPLENSPPIEAPNIAYIDDLNTDWPLGTDYPSDGDNHIRGIKNVLKQTFPGLTGPVTLTQDEINSGSKLLEAGTVCLFYQQTAPTGWTRVNPTVGNRMMVVSTGTTGVEGGTDEPIFNNKVPEHNHAVYGSTAANATSHYHSVTLDGGGHEHNYTVTNTSTYQLGLAPSLSTNWQFYQQSQRTEATSGAGAHTHSGSTGANIGDHVHEVNIGSAVNEGAESWVPRYTVCLMASRDS